MADRSTLRFNSFNTRGLGEGCKRRTVFNWLRQFHRGVTLLQETHTTEAVEKQWMQKWGGHIEFSHGTCGSRGVAVLFPKKLDVKLNHKIKDVNGRFILIDMTLDSEHFILVNIYAPTKDKEGEQINFLTYIENILQDYSDRNIIIGGDLNTCLDPLCDKSGGKKRKPFLLC